MSDVHTQELEQIYIKTQQRDVGQERRDKES